MRESRYTQTFCHNVQVVMEERGISKTQLAEKLGVSKQAVGQMLGGKYNLTIERAERVADVLEKPLTELLDHKLQLQGAA